MPGVLAAPLDVARGNHIVWFRSEYVHEIEWAHGGRWLIEAADVEFAWIPHVGERAEAVGGSDRGV